MVMQLLVNHLEPASDRATVGGYLQPGAIISSRRRCSLSQSLDVLQQSLAETLANGTSGPEGSSGNVANYMGQMFIWKCGKLYGSNGHGYGKIGDP
jgi:transcription factor TGA